MAINGRSKGKKRAAIASSDSEHSEPSEEDVQTRRRTNGNGVKSSDRSSKRRKVQTHESDKDDSNDEDATATAGPSRTNGNGHHVNGNGRPPMDVDEDDSGVSDDGLEVEEGQMVRTQKPVAPMQNLVRHENGYVPGSIRRIKLHNFLTYSNVEFSPGPHLNLVIGPNGTGKSSIVCGIALGLGFPPKVLGRAPDVASFIMTGQNEAFVELELEGKTEGRTVIINRSFKKGKGSVWHLDGKTASAQQVADTVSGLGIQLDNLCCFLPQDKVASFAAMSPKELLKATMKAANEVRLPEWHEVLISAENKLSDLVTDLDSNKARLDKIKEKIEELEEIVQASNERRNLEEKLDKYGLFRLWVVYHKKKQEFLKLKEKVDAAKAKLKAKGLEGKPLKELLAHVKDRASKAESVTRANRDKAEKAEREINRVRANIEKEAESADTVQNKLTSLRAGEQDRKAKIEDLDKKVKKFDDTLRDEPEVDEDKAKKVEAKRTNIRREIARLEALDGDDNVKKGNIKDSVRRLQDQINQYLSSIAALNDVRRKRREFVAQKQPQIGYAMNWIEKNRALFEKEVFFPPASEVDIRDPRYTRIIEACVNRNTMLTFVAQTPNDYRTLNRLNDEDHYYQDRRDRKRVRISTYQVTDTEIADVDAPPRVSVEQLRHYRLHGYAMDFIKAEAPLKAYLRSARLHETAVSSEYADVDEATKLGLRQFIHLEGQVLSSVSVKTSLYGNRANQTQTNAIGQPTFFSAGVSQADIDNYQNQIGIARTSSARFGEELAKIDAERTKRSTEKEKLQNSYTDVQAEITRIANAQRRIRAAKTDRDVALRELDRLRKLPSVDQQRDRLKEDLQTSAKKRFQMAMKATPNLKALTEVTVNLSENCLSQLQTQADKAQIDPMVHQGEERIQRYRDKLEEYTAVKDKARQDAQTTQEEYSEEFDEIKIKYRKDFTPEFEQLNHTVDEIDAIIADTQSDIALQPEVDNAAEARLQREKGDFEEMNKLVTQQAAKKAKIDRQHEEAKNDFEPALETLVDTVSEKFGEALSKVSVVGQVHLRRTPKYEDWALEILVKFRDNEELQVLSHRRQSGGERSLTTIMFLMSLMKLSRTPFSLVDEINQGMDQRNERAVHNLLVETTSRGSAGQYFLITPKLLTGLYYNEKMRILCINNGDWLPDPSKGDQFGDLKSLLGRIARQVPVPTE